MHEAACLCGATRYLVSGPLDDVVLCHCSQCRRANGAAFNVGVIVARSQVEFVADARVQSYESSPGKFRAFCGGCGAPVYSHRVDRPEVMRLRGGLIADLPRPMHLRNAHWADRWPWLDAYSAAPIET